MMEKQLEFTGERLTTTKSNEIVTHHLHRYALAQKLVEKKVVLDIACGEGYGTALLAQYADHVYGVDIDEQTVRFANDKYNLKNVHFKTGSTSAIPLDDNSVDVVVSFETIEHHDEHEQMMLEVKRVLRNDGLFIISSPDKLVYSDKTGFNNPFHIKELYREEFKLLLEKHFNQVQMYYQAVKYGSLIVPDDWKGEGFEFFNGGFKEINGYATIDFPEYNLALASNSTLLPSLIANTSFFNAEELLLDMRNKEIEIYNSKTYKAGLFITWPLRVLRKVFSK